MKKALIGLILSGILLATILPSGVLAATCSSESASANTGILGRSSIRGFALYLGMDSTGSTIHLFAIRLHFTSISLTGIRDSGIIHMRPIDIPTKITGYHGYVYISASFRGTIDV